MRQTLTKQRTKPSRKAMIRRISLTVRAKVVATLYLVSETATAIKAFEGHG